MPIRFVDPLALKPARLSVGTVQWWSGRTPVSPASPLAPLLTRSVEAKQKNDVELKALGVLTETPSPSGKLYDEALQIVSQPQALLDIAELVPGETPFHARLVLARGKAVICDIDTGGVSFSSPMLVAELTRAISRHFENTSETAPAPVTWWRSQLTGLSTLFGNDETKGIDEQVTFAKALSRFAPSGVTESQLRGALEELVGSGLLEKTADGVKLASGAAFWMKRVGTSVVGELTLETYDDEGVAVPAQTQVRFVGKPGDRVTAVTYLRDELKALSDGEPKEVSAVGFSALKREKLLFLLESFVGGTEPRKNP